MTARLTCVATTHQVVRGERRPLPCGRPACAMRDGRPYCRDHDPDAGVLRAGRRRRRTRRALERELEAMRARRSLDVGLFLGAMDRLRATERERDRLKARLRRAFVSITEATLLPASSAFSYRFEPSAVRALLAAFIATAPRDAWRHHGIGVLQAYVREGTDTEVRMHVWHPDLVRPGIRESGAIHDHRFDLVSHVVAGKLRERVFETRPDPDGEWEAWSVENARSAGAEKGFDGECLPTGSRFSARAHEREHHAGDRYTLARQVFHETIVDSELAVTLCVMRTKVGQARLLVRHGEQPVHAFGAPASEAVIERVLREARQELELW